MASVYDIVRGINQAAANAYDGSHDSRYVEEGEDKVIGLKREQDLAVLPKSERKKIAGPGRAKKKKTTKKEEVKE